MVEKTTIRSNLELPAYGALGAVIIALPTMIFGNDIGTFFITLLLGAIVSLILLIIAVQQVRRRALSVLSMLTLFCAVGVLLFRVSEDVRTTGRWLIRSKHYKAEVLAQPNSAKGELKHVEWDGWGFPGAGDTVMYLVFDPNDSLAAPGKSRSPGKFNGIPCEVVHVRRVENHWYTALFYTDTDWDHCS
jgi:hypothetical protein